MTKGLCGYGRYPDGHVGCPYAKTDMTPCIARDGKVALADDLTCVGCNNEPRLMLEELAKAGVDTGPSRGEATSVRQAGFAAERLCSVVAFASEGRFRATKQEPICPYCRVRGCRSFHFKPKTGETNA